MLSGYSFWEAVWKRREKENFLKNNLSTNEKRIYETLGNAIIIGLVALFTYTILFFIFFERKLNYLMLIMATANFLMSVTKQGFRKMMLVKYRYYKKVKLWQNVLISFWIIIAAILTIFGTFFVVYKLFAFI